MKITWLPSVNFEERKDDIHFIIIHATGTPNLKSTLQQLVHSQQPDRVSCHYVIDTDGSIYQLVKDDKTAWHAGISDWKDYAQHKGLRGLNHSSIGIEIQSEGLSYDTHSNEVLTFQNPTSDQLKSCRDLCKKLMQTYHINVENVLRHSDVSPDRKFDPGENFPWDDLKISLADTFS